MWSLIVSSFIISALHGILPNHWLPIITIGKEEKWTRPKLLKITFISAMAHALSTIIIGIIIAWLGSHLAHEFEHMFHLIAPIMLILLGLFFIYQHYKHNHFHLHGTKEIKNRKSETKIILALVLAMFLSPCLEIEAVYIAAGAIGIEAIIAISVIYLVVSVIGMLVWVFISSEGLNKFDWHKIEHNSGIITGVVIILTGISMFFLH